MSAAKKFKPSDSEESNEMEQFQLLPDHVWSKAFSYLENRSKFNVALTCRRFNDIVKTYSEVYETFQITLLDPVECENYKNGSTYAFRIPHGLTRPISTVKLNFGYCGALLSEIPGLFDSILAFFVKNGKFVKKISFNELDIDQHSLYQIFNEIPNANSIQFDSSIVGNRINLQEFDVRHNFKKLKILELCLVYEPQDLSIDILEKFFGNARNISTLKIPHAYNLLYNKPKLEHVVLQFNDTAFSMESSSVQNEIPMGLKSLKFFIDYPRMPQDPWSNFKHLEKYVKAQHGIENFSVEPWQDVSSTLLDNVIQHVTGLDSLKRCEIYSELHCDRMFFSKRSNAEELRLSSNLEITLPFFPNLRRLFVDCPHYNISVDFQVMNELNLLEELVISADKRITNLEKIALPKLKKLTFGGKSLNLLEVCEFALIILRNHPNIEEFTLGEDLGPENHMIDWHKTLMRTLKKPKRYCCVPYFHEAIDYQFLDVFVNEGKHLEELVFYLLEDVKIDENTERLITEYFRGKNSSLKCECIRLKCYVNILDLQWNSVFYSE